MKVDRLTIKKRVRIAALTVAMMAVVALPAVAHAATWTSEYPVTTLKSQPAVVGADVFGATLNANLATVTVDGVALKTFVTQGNAGGHWTSSEALVNGVYRTTWAWTADTGGLTKATVFAFPGILGDGVHNVAISAVDVNGVALADPGFSFTIQAGPTFGAVASPVAGTSVNTTVPVISIPVADNTGVTAVTATVNGNAATATFAAGTLTVTGFGTLADGPATVAVTASDAAGNTSAKSWTFTVSTTGQACLSCHNATNTDPAVAPFNKDYTIDPAMGADCVSCHYGDFAPHGFEMNASGHNTTIEGKVGAKTKFDGSQGVTLQFESEISSASLPATWLVGGQGPVYAPTVGGVPISSITTGQIGTLTTKWELPTQSVFWSSSDASAPATAKKGLSWTSTITCQDCHTGLNAAGPHGSSDNFGIDPNYPGGYEYAELSKYVTANTAWPTTNSNYNTPFVSGIAMFPGAATNANITSTIVNVIPSGASSALANRTDGTTGTTAVICAKCHKLENFISAANGGVNAVEGANTAHDSHHQDQLDGSAQCINCHIGLPHSWKRPRLLLNSDEDVAPYRSAQQLGTTRTTSTGNNTGNTIKLTAGWGQGFNGQGLQSLSAVDNHTLAVTTAGHTGLAVWTEASCQACGDHAGEDGIRIKEGN
jgi:nitrate/TMAO reductase-like tetraheme cytochrome c subunit/methionine-rich copper-binding protein CopC